MNGKRTCSRWMFSHCTAVNGEKIHSLVLIEGTSTDDCTRGEQRNSVCVLLGVFGVGWKGIRAASP